MTRIVVAAPAVTPPMRMQARTRRAADIEPQPVAWLWEPHLALGKLSMVVGDPGLGKSTLTAALAAHVTNSRNWPDGTSCPQGDVLMVNAEDDPADTIRPRLDAAGADVQRVHLLDDVVDSQLHRARTFKLADVEVLDEFIERNSAVKLVIIDPLSAYLCGVDTHKDADVRGILAPITQMAAARGVAVVAISHLNKSKAAAIYRSTGSLAFVAAARSAYLLARSDDADDKRLLLPIKNNLGPDGAGVAYWLRSTDARIPYVEWCDEPVRQTADDVLSAGMGSSDDRSATEDCADWLRAVLSEGEARAAEIMRQADGYGFSAKVLRRARERIGVKTVKSGVRAGWVWSL